MLAAAGSVRQAPIAASRRGHVRGRVGEHGGGGGAAALVPPSMMGLPPGVDPLMLDPDEAFVRFSVREVQTIEQSLSTSCDTLTARLRLLVSERYRDMLGTANTLIDMSTSSTNLVQQLDLLMSNIQAAEDSIDAPSTSGLTGSAANNGAGPLDVVQSKQCDLFAVAACTKLVSEAPDEVWRAMEASNRPSATSVGALKQDLQAATTLRAAYIFVLAQEAWAWLTEKDGLRDSLAKRLQLGNDFDTQSLFPYIAQQQAALEPMRMLVEAAALSGMDGLISVKSGDPRSSGSYLSTVTYMTSLSLLDLHSLSRCQAELLKRRKDSLQAYVQSYKGTPSLQRSPTLTQILRHIADTLLHVVRAFALPSRPGKQSCHLEEIHSRLSAAAQIDDHDSPAFPPSPLATLQTLPSAGAFVDHLPDRVRFYSWPPTEDGARGSRLKEDVAVVLQRWSDAVFQEILAESLPDIVGNLSTIAGIGEVQSELWSTLDKCIFKAHRSCKASGGQRYAVAMAKELRLVVKRIDALLMDRLRGICQTQGDELSRVVVQSMRAAFEQICEPGNRMDVTEDPVRFVFTSSRPSGKQDAHSESLGVLSQKLQVRTEKVQSILSNAEQRATSLAGETRAYTAAIEWAQARLERKNEARSMAAMHESDDQAGGIEAAKEVLVGLRLSVRQAKLSIAEALADMSGQCEGISEPQASEARLFLVRLLSALRSSEVFDAVEQDVGKGAGEVREDTSFASRLLDIERGLLRIWAESAVRDAMGAFQHTIDRRTEGSEGNDQALPRSVSPELLAAFACLSHRCQIVGLGRRSEDLWLRREVIARFVQVWTDGWMQAGMERDSDTLEQVLFDGEVIRAISTERSSTDVRHLEQLAGLAKRLSSRVNISAQDITAQLPPALSRCRLTIGRLVLDEDLLTEHIVDVHNRARTAGKPVSASSAPPLPLLQLVQQRERIPRVRATVGGEYR